MSAQDHIPPRPDWLDDEFIKTIIKNDVGSSSIDDIDINDIEIQYAVPKGENYTSIILRLIVKGVLVNSNKKYNGHLVNGSTKYQNGSVNGSVNEKRYIVKVPQTDGDMVAVMNDFQAFSREVDMYINLVPKFQNVLAHVGLETKFACRCLNVLLEKSVYVMEDLGVEKYILADRKKGADLEHTKLMIRKMARLHGASMKYYEETQFKGVAKYYYEGMIRHIEDEELRERLDPIFGRSMITGKVKELVEDIRRRPGYENEANLVENLTDHAYDLLCDLFKFKPGNIFNAQLHGDCWINNVLYKYNDAGKPIDILLLDLQCSYINSVGNEFMYFFLSSTSDEVRQHHYHDVVNFYYDNFTETLKKVEYKGIIPTLEQLYEELISTSTIFLMSISFMLCVVKAELDTDAKDRSKSEGVSFVEIHQIAENNRKNPAYTKTLFHTMDLLKEIGTFDYLKNTLKN